MSDEKNNSPMRPMTFDELVAEITRLKQEVERLTKHNDTMASEDDAEIRALTAERGRMKKAILTNWTNVRGDGSCDYCIHCGADVIPDGNQTGQPDDNGTIICNHHPDCIVLQCQPESGKEEGK